MHSRVDLRPRQLPVVKALTVGQQANRIEAGPLRIAHGMFDQIQTRLKAELLRIAATLKLDAAFIMFPTVGETPSGSSYRRARRTLTTTRNSSSSN
jgi:hypothetical protein